MYQAKRLKTAAAAVVGVLVAGCSSSGGAHATKTTAAPAGPIAVTGSVTLTDPDSTLNAALTGTHDCGGVGGYSDIKEGAQVVISDDAGKTLTISHLTAGQTPEQKTGLNNDCVFGFTAQVPAGKRFYGVQVTHRGVVKMAEAELPSASLSIGS